MSDWGKSDLILEGIVWGVMLGMFGVLIAVLIAIGAQ